MRETIHIVNKSLITKGQGHVCHLEAASRVNIIVAIGPCYGSSVHPVEVGAGASVAQWALLTPWHEARRDPTTFHACLVLPGCHTVQSWRQVRTDQDTQCWELREARGPAMVGRGQSWVGRPLPCPTSCPALPSVSDTHFWCRFACGRVMVWAGGCPKAKSRKLRSPL